MTARDPKGALMEFTRKLPKTGNSVQKSSKISTTLLGLIAFVGSLALPIEAVAQHTSPRLLFAQQSGDICNIRYWHEFASEAVILARTAECPERLFVDARRQMVFVIDGEEIRTLRIYPATESDPVALPNRDYKVWLESMEPSPDQDSSYNAGARRLLPIGIRYLDDGSLGVLMSLGMPADDVFHYLFKRGEDDWSIVAQRWCHRWGCKEPEDRSDPFHSDNYISTRDDRTWSEERMIWHPSFLHNEFVVFRNEAKYEVSPGLYDGSILEIGLAIDGTRSTLKTYVSSSEHSDTLHTFNVDLSIDSGSPKNLSKNQCLTSIAGKHILVDEFFRGRFELTDLSTGETVFSNLSTAAWID